MRYNIIGKLIILLLTISCNSKNNPSITVNEIYVSGIDDKFIFEKFDSLPLNKAIKPHIKGSTATYYKDTIFSQLKDDDGAIASVMGPMDKRMVQRAEFSLQLDKYYYKKNAYLAFDFLVPSTFDVDENNLGRETMIFQIHSKPNKGETWQYYKDQMPYNRPSIAIYLGKNKSNYYLSLRYGLNGDTDKAYKDYKWFLAGYKNIEPNEWHTIKLNYKLSDTNTGFIQSWINGKSFTPFNGKHNKIYGAKMHNEAPPYLKFGLYRAWPDTHTHEVDYDNLVIANKLENLLNEDELEKHINVNKKQQKVPIRL